jgi:hypothetical protein
MRRDAVIRRLEAAQFCKSTGRCPDFYHFIKTIFSKKHEEGCSDPQIGGSPILQKHWAMPRLLPFYKNDFQQAESFL